MAINILVNKPIFDELATTNNITVLDRVQLNFMKVQKYFNK